MKKIFIDGSAGTTGLKIYERLQNRKDVELIILPENLRKDIDARKQAINSSDVAILCLPDQASIEAVSLVENPNTVIIDTSTAYRTADGWTYGFPELYGDNEVIKSAKRIANPGCHASGFIAIVYPLIKCGLISKDLPLTCFSITGYTGGGKKMIAEYEDGDIPTLYKAPRQYGLTQKHKHLPEMQKVCGLSVTPIFCPIVSDFARGMEVSVPIFMKDVNGSIDDVKNAYKKEYKGKLVHFDENSDENGFLSANAYSGKDDMGISINGNDERIVITARFDNLGKGASGSALQNLNIVLEKEEDFELEI